MISVRTPSRLHFGLLNLAAATDARWSNHDGQLTLPVRSFGGVGLMVREPGITLRASPEPTWTSEGPLAERALTFAKRYTGEIQRERPEIEITPQHIVIGRAAPEHAGLGTGTQLGMAVAEALGRAWGINESPAVLARRVGRGLRSALGVHGFAHGGFLVEAGKRDPAELSPLVVQTPFPDDWPIVLICPSQMIGLHGQHERDAFTQLVETSKAKTQTEALCRLALLGLLPTLCERDFETFGEALYDFNARSGAMFASVQGGVYSSALVAEIVTFVRGLGIKGVGQSSWGPTVFAVVRDRERANELAQRVRGHFALTPSEVFITHASNRGAV